jgi:hypothetical protein
MHSGVLMVIRRFIVYAKPWQQVLACMALVAAGLSLVAVGVRVGVVMAIVGLLLGWQLMKARRSNRILRAEGDVEQSENA